MYIWDRSSVNNSLTSEFDYNDYKNTMVSSQTRIILFKTELININFLDNYNPITSNANPSTWGIFNPATDNISSKQ